MFESLKIKSASGVYEVDFDQTEFTKLSAFISGSTHYILDARIAKCYPEILREVIENPNTVIVDANEYSKDNARY